MTEEDFRELVGRCERLAARRPALYRAGALLLLALGLGYVLFWVLLCLALGLTCLWAGLAGDSTYALVQLGIVLLALAALLARALWVRFDAPEGRRLTRAEAPILWQTLDELRILGKAPLIHEVVLEDTFSAAVVQRPRFGLLGGSRNYLVLGLPYLLALDPDQFRAVLAHELGHLAGAHGRFGAWIYRVRRVWAQLPEGLARGQARMTWWFRPFLERYAPLFNAYTFALARAQELEADRFAAEVAGTRAVAESLVVSHVLGRHLEEDFWPSLRRRAADEPEPPRLHHELTRCFRELPAADAHALRDRLLGDDADPLETHPALRDRLLSLGQKPPPMPPEPPETAAQHYLGRVLPGLLASFDEQWRGRVGESWRAANVRAGVERERLQALEARRGQGDILSEDEAFEHARLVEDHRSSEEAELLYRALLARSPRHARAAFALGRHLLDAGVDRGIEHLEVAMENEPDLVVEGCTRAIEHLRATGRPLETAPYRARLQAAQMEVEASESERNRLERWDTFLPHGMESAPLEKIVADLRAVRAVKRAYLVRKKLRFFPTEPPVYVLAIERRWSLLRALYLALFGTGIGGLMRDPALKVLDQLARHPELPAGAFVVLLGVWQRALGRQIRDVPGSRIWP